MVESQKIYGYLISILFLRSFFRIINNFILRRDKF